MPQNMDEKPVTQEIIRFGRELHQRKLICGYDGNISYRLDQDEYLITKSWSSLGFLSEDDVVKIDHEGNVLDGKFRPTGEFRLHMVAYRERPDIYCVVHAHPMFATVWASWGRPIPAFILPELGVVFGEDIPIAPYGSTGTPQIAESIAELIRTARWGVAIPPWGGDGLQQGTRSGFARRLQQDGKDRIRSRDHLSLGSQGGSHPAA